MFGRLFGRGGGPADPVLPEIRNITIGRTVRLDPLAWRRLGGATRFSLDTNVLEITAQGLIDMGADGFVHRFYTDDELMLQVVSRDRDGQRDEDHTLFMPWTSAWPPNSAARRAWMDRLKARTFTADGLPDYQRLWFGAEDELQEPVTLWESVYDDREMSAERRIFQTCMLFSRDLPGDARELLLAIENEPQGGDLTHDVMIGIQLDIAELEA